MKKHVGSSWNVENAATARRFDALAVRRADSSQELLPKELWPSGPGEARTVEFRGQSFTVRDKDVRLRCTRCNAKHVGFGCAVPRKRKRGKRK